MLHAMVSGVPARPAAAPAAQIRTASRCVRVGQKVLVRGGGFAPGLPYELSVDGVDFGQSLVGPDGTFTSGVVPGGLGAGQPQIVDVLTASDGVRRASTAVTITRGTGALFTAGVGGSPQRTVHFEVWDFAARGPEVPVYLHYVAPGARRATATVALGRSRGACGALVSRPRPLFGFTPAAGTWTLQFDTERRFSPAPAGRFARLSVAVG